MNIPRAVESGLIGTLCLLLLQACAGNGKGLDANGRPIGESSGDSSSGSEVTADLASIQQNIFTPICSVCHIGGGAPEGLRLDQANAYNLLVNVPSTEMPTLMRVKPGDPDDSYIIQKLEGHAAVGARMPLGGPYLSDATVASIRQWISAGAVSGSAAAPAAVALTLKAIVPDATEPVSESPPQVSVVFSHDLDVSQLAGLSVRMRNSAGASMPARVDSPPGNARVLLLTPRGRLGVGRYQVLVRAPDGAVVRDLFGHALPLGEPDASGESVLSSFQVEVLP